MRTTVKIRASLLFLPILATAAFAVPANAEVQAGRNLEVNHSIQLGVIEGWAADQTVRVDVLRGVTTIATKTVRTTSGTVDINHLGGDDCWEGVSPGTTPDIKPGDKVVATVLDGTGADTADVDYFFVRDIVFGENPTNGTITGHARGQETTPGVFDITAPVNPVAEVMEAIRVEAGKVARPFGAGDLDGNGNFANIAVGGTPGAGALTIDHLDESGGGTGTTTANRTSDPVDIPCGPIATTALSSVSHDVINIANVGTPMTVGGPRLSTVTVTLTLDGTPYTVSNDNGAGTWSAQIPATDLQALLQGNHQLVASFSDGAPAETRTILKDTIAPAAPSATPAPGTYTSAQAVTISGESGAILRYTNNGSTPTTSSLAANGPIPVTASQTLKAIAIDGAGNLGAIGTFAYVIQPPAQQTAGGGAAGGVTTILPAPALGGSTAGNTNTVAPAQLALKRLLTAAKVKRSTARLRGIRLSMELASGTNVVKINVYRRSGGKLKLISSGFKTTSNSGVYRVRQNHASLRRLLRIGSYEVRVTPGRSRTDLGKTSKASFKVVR